eukprot:c23283_g2_i1 orf=1-513(-)
MTMKMGIVRTETKKSVDDYVSLQWGQCKRPRLSKAGAVQLAQRSDAVCLPDTRSTHQLCHMQPKPAAAEEAPGKGETENRNGQTRRRTELESLHDKHLVMKELNLAVSRWPKLLISLSHKEKEDDFMVMKGSRLPQRPKKRAKHVEKFVTYVSPGAWLCEVSLDRYEVREK